MPRITDARREARRLAYLGAAWRCFARAGIHAVTMEDVSREAGASQGAVYLYFPSKDALIRAAISESLARFEALAVIGDRAPLDAVADLLTAASRAARTEDGVDLFAIALQGWAFSRTDEQADEVITRSYRRVLDGWAASGRASGLSARDARDQAQTAGCLVLGFIAQRAILGTPSVAAVSRAVRTAAVVR